METYKPISTISFNTNDFLKQTLDDLYHEHIIQFYAYIHHFPEPKDEYGRPETKEHFHVYIKPAKTLDTFQLQKRFEEPDLAHPEQALPLGCLDFDSSKFVDWFLYGLHDVDYLSFKGLSRVFHYTVDEIKCISDDALNEEIHKCDFTRYKNFKALKEAVNAKTTFKSLLLNGFVPIQQIYAYERAYAILTFDEKQRAGFGSPVYVLKNMQVLSCITNDIIGLFDFCHDVDTKCYDFSKIHYLFSNNEVYDSDGCFVGYVRKPFENTEDGV